MLYLYQGEFLQGFYLREAVHFEEWVLAQREELRLLTLRWLEVWVAGCLAQGAYEQGLTANRRLLQLEPWSEPAHCLQMQLLAQSGRRAEALAQYETCRKVLAAELDVEPLPTTTTLYQQIKAGQYPGTSTPQQAVGSDALLQAPPPVKATVIVKPAVPHNLVTPLAGFIGRQRELDLLSQRLCAPDCRLLTVVGSGGMGKTSLAHAVAQHLLHTAPHAFPDGLYFVGLAGLETQPHAPPAGKQIETLLVTAIAERIGCNLQPGLPPQAQLQSYLRECQLLLILNNFEHLLAATDMVLALLSAAPKLTLFITSRARLNVRGETVLALDKLSLPSVTTHPTPTVDGWQASEAVGIFVQRACCLDPHFTVNAANLGPIAQSANWSMGCRWGSSWPLACCRC